MLGFFAEFCLVYRPQTFRVAFDIQSNMKFLNLDTVHFCPSYWSNELWNKVLNFEEKQQSWLPVVWFNCLVKIVKDDSSYLIKCIFEIIFYTWKQKSRSRNIWPHYVPRNWSNAHSFWFTTCIQKWTIFVNNQIIIQIKFDKIVFMISRSRCTIKTNMA